MEAGWVVVGRVARLAVVMVGVVKVVATVGEGMAVGKGEAMVARAANKVGWEKGVALEMMAERAVVGTKVVARA